MALDNLGDLVFTSVVFRALAQRFPKAEFGVWCKDYTKAAAELLPCTPEVFASDPFWDRSPGHGRGSFLRFAATLNAIRRRRFDTAIVCSQQWRAAAAVRIAGIPKRIGYSGKKTSRWLTDAVDRPDHVHVTRELLALVEPLSGPASLDASSVAYKLRREALRTDVDAMMRNGASTDLPNGYVCLHAFAGDPARCWSLGNWIELAARISANGKEVVWLGSPRELAAVRTIADKNGQRVLSAADIAGAAKDPLATTIAASAAFIGHDSGPLHVAAALGVPTLGLFLPGTPGRTATQGVGPAKVLVRERPEALTFADVWGEYSVLSGRIQ